MRCRRKLSLARMERIRHRALRIGGRAIKVVFRSATLFEFFIDWPLLSTSPILAVLKEGSANDEGSRSATRLRQFRRSVRMRTLVIPGALLVQHAFAGNYSGGIFGHFTMPQWLQISWLLSIPSACQDPGEIEPVHLSLAKTRSGMLTECHQMRGIIGIDG